MNFSRSSLVLTFVVTLLSGMMIIHFFYSITREPIHQAEIKKQAKIIQKLMPLAYDNDLLNDKIERIALGDLGTADPVPIYRARKGNQPIGVIILPVAPDGYSGPIKLAVSINFQGEVLAINILEHHETADFGDAIDQDHSDWLKQFIGKNALDIEEKNGIDQISGASVSSKAVTTAIMKCLAFYHREKEQIWK